MNPNDYYYVICSMDEKGELAGDPMDVQQAYEGNPNAFLHLLRGMVLYWMGLTMQRRDDFQRKVDSLQTLANELSSY